MRTITLTKHQHDVDQPRQGSAGTRLGAGMVPGNSEERGAAVYRGQSAEEILGIAAISEPETEDVGHYAACAIARDIVRYLDTCRS